MKPWTGVYWLQGPDITNLEFLKTFCKACEHCPWFISASGLSTNVKYFKSTDWMTGSPCNTILLGSTLAVVPSEPRKLGRSFAMPRKSRADGNEWPRPILHPPQKNVFPPLYCSTFLPLSLVNTGLEGCSWCCNTSAAALGPIEELDLRTSR